MWLQLPNGEPSCFAIWQLSIGIKYFICSADADKWSKIQQGVWLHLMFTFSLKDKFWRYDRSHEHQHRNQYGRRWVFKKTRCWHCKILQPPAPESSSLLSNEKRSSFIHDGDISLATLLRISSLPMVISMPLSFQHHLARPWMGRWSFQVFELPSEVI